MQSLVSQNSKKDSPRKAWQRKHNFRYSFLFLSVDADLFICFRDTKNGVIQKLISADRAQMAQSENQIFYRKIRI